MNLPLPEAFQPALSADRLESIAEILIDEHFSTLTDLQGDYDDGYTRGCTRFGRQRNRLRALALSSQYDWLDLLHGGNDMVFSIGRIPCRFTTDDPANPTKPAVLEVSPAQRSFFEEVEAGTPCKFCFILDGGYGEEDDPQVVFIGEDTNGNIRCKWTSGGMKTLHVVAADTPPSKVIGKAPVGPKRTDSDKAEKSGTA